MNTEALILSETYFDTVTVKRKEKVKDPITGITTTIEKIIIEGERCAVSKNNTSNINGEIGSIVSTHTLFINPLADIQAGDTIEVTNEITEKTIYLASKPYYYKSHRETPITENDRV